MSWKNGPKRKNNDSPPFPWRYVPILIVVLALCATSQATDKLKDLQDHFDRETHAGGKIKQLQKLSAAQFAAAADAGNRGDFETVGFIFEKYRDNVRAALQLLRKQEPDADRHPGGYRQLELDVRQGLREVEDTMLVAPEPMRPPLEIVHKDLLDMDDALINLLFPRRTKEPVRVPPSPEAKP